MAKAKGEEVRKGGLLRLRLQQQQAHKQFLDKVDNEKDQEQSKE